MKRLAFIIFLFVIISSSVMAQNLNDDFAGAEIRVKFYNKTMYYPGSSVDNPIFVHITVANKGPQTLRFKLADDRMFSIDFNAFTTKNTSLEKTDTIIRKRTTNRTVYFREIALESNEEYSFVENLKDYINIESPSLYYVEVLFYPELYKSRLTKLTSNRLTLDIKPSPNATAAGSIAVERKNYNILTPEAVSPDIVVERTIIARQNNQWDPYFLYFDIEQMLMNEPVRNRKYRTLSAEERQRMITNYKIDLMQKRIDSDIVAIPESFEVERTTYTKTEGTVTVIQWFKYDTFREKKRYTYFVRKRDDIWLIYNYSVENLGAE
ncbi:MAG: hypothetical protein GX220_07185 [Treponema sp.]|nr:hypothetical protein [Treponema sp.]